MVPRRHQTRRRTIAQSLGLSGRSSRPAPKRRSSNSFLIGATRQAGVAAADLPDDRNIVRHVIAALGSAEYGNLQVSPAYQPHQTR